MTQKAPETPLDPTVTSIFEAIEEKHEACLAHFIQCGQANAVNAQGQTPLMQTIQAGWQEGFEALLQDADLDRMDDDQKSALMWATIFEKKRMVERLLEQGANARLQDRVGMTALMWAAFYSGTSLEVLKVLLPYSDARAKDSAGETALMLAANGSLAAVECLLPFSDADAMDHEGCTALLHADRHQQRDVVTCLLPNMRVFNESDPVSLEVLNVQLSRMVNFKADVEAYRLQKQEAHQLRGVVEAHGSIARPVVRKTQL